MKGEPSCPCPGGWGGRPGLGEGAAAGDFRSAGGLGLGSGYTNFVYYLGGRGIFPPRFWAGLVGLGGRRGFSRLSHCFWLPPPSSLTPPAPPAPQPPVGPLPPVAGLVSGPPGLALVACPFGGGRCGPVGTGRLRGIGISLRSPCRRSAATAPPAGVCPQSAGPMIHFAFVRRPLSLPSRCALASACGSR